MTTDRSGLLLLAEPSLRVAAGTTAVVLTLLGCAAVGAGTAPTLLLTYGVLLVSCVGLRPAPAVALGVIAWAFVTGFVLHGLGVLTFGRADLARLLLLVAAGLVGSLVRPRRGLATPERVPAATVSGWSPRSMRPTSPAAPRTTGADGA